MLIGAVALFWLIPRPYRLGALAVTSFAYLCKLDPVNTGVLAVWVLLFYVLAPKAADKKSAWRWATPVFG